ncbi:inositol monophosphatase family protein [Labedaea rhizosphaerae]|nr:inositol monophosphatase family protein [Labedaea rhizosphaerae]
MAVAAEDPALSHLAATAMRVASSAAELVARVRAEAVAEVDTKSSETDVVTAGDKAAERLVRDELARLRPGEVVLGEEAGASGEPGPGAVCWVVDPIDGTVNYLYGFPWFAVSVAAQVDGVSVAGAVVEPVSGRRWSAVRGQGATLDGAPLHVSAARRLELSLVATGFGYRAERRARQAAAVAKLLPEVRDIRRAGAASLDLCAVAAGWVDGYCEHGLNRWDWAAGALIAEEAGAVVRLPSADAPLGPDAVFVAAPGIADQLHETLLRCGFGEI